MKTKNLFLSALLAVSVAGIAACGTRVSIGDQEPARTVVTAAPQAPAEMAAPLEAPTWEWLNPKPFAQHFRGVHGTSESDVWLVGDQGSVYHWDGATLEKRYDGHPSESFWAVWASAPDDVWIAGDAGGTGSRVLHWNGMAFEDDFTLAKGRVHALWGSAEDDVWAAVDDGAIGDLLHWNGRAWSSSLVSGDVIRDVHGVDRDHVYAVGRSGQLYALLPNTSLGSYANRWDRMPVLGEVGGAPTDPTGRANDPANDYVAVWANAPTDVTAVFVKNSGSDFGYSHFDGHVWSVVQAGNDPSGLGLDGRNGAPLPVGPLRRGRLLTTSPGSDLVFAGVDSIPERGGSVPSSAGSLAPQWEQVTPVNAVGYFHGLFHAPQGSLFAAEPLGGFSVERAGAQGHFAELIPNGGRDTLVAVAAHGERAYAINASSRLVAWDGSRWLATNCPLEVADVTMGDDGTVWVSGKLARPGPWQAAVAYGDGTTWTVSAFPMGSTAPNVAEWAASVVVTEPGVAFAVVTTRDFSYDRFAVFRLQAGTWSEVPTPPLHGIKDGRIGGKGANVWLTVSAWPEPNVLLQWTGAKFELVPAVAFNEWSACCGAGRMGRPWLASPVDVWLPSKPAHRWRSGMLEPLAGGDLFVRGITGSGPDDVWLVGDGPRSGIIRNWDGAHLTTALETSATLFDVTRASNGDLWAVGNGGATLRRRSGGRR